jgi:hypothetical protein
MGVCGIFVLSDMGLVVKLLAYPERQMRVR